MSYILARGYTATSKFSWFQLLGLRKKESLKENKLQEDENEKEVGGTPVAKRQMCRSYYSKC